MASGVGSVGIGSSLAGGILSAFGAAEGGSRTQQMYNYQARVAQINANIDKQNAEWAFNKGQVEGVQYGMKAQQEYGALRVTQAASNLDIGSGSALSTSTSQRAVARMDINQIQTNAAKTAYDYGVRSTADTNQAALDVMAGTNAKLAGDIGAASSILGTVGSVSSKWMQGSQAGMFASGSGSSGGFNPFNTTGSLY